jgi:hypothetical protein
MLKDAVVISRTLDFAQLWRHVGHSHCQLQVMFESLFECLKHAIDC